MRFKLTVVLWLGLILTTQLYLEFRESKSGVIPQHSDWPAESSISRDPFRPTLLMFVHPCCPCSKISMEELNTIKNISDRVKLTFVVLTPETRVPDWNESECIRQISFFPEAEVVRDLSGREAKLFHATSSGEINLFSPEGKLLFSGGITAGRGRYGENDGKTTVAEISQNVRTSRTNWPVFGCPLFDTEK